MDIYAQNILDRYKEPFYKDNDFEADFQHEEANHSCGDKVEVKLKISDDKVTDYSFSGVGCAISIASADIIGDLIDGLSAEEVLAMNKDELYEALGIEISLRRSKCALLAQLAIQNAILSGQNQPLRSWTYFHL